MPYLDLHHDVTHLDPPCQNAYVAQCKQVKCKCFQVSLSRWTKLENIQCIWGHILTKGFVNYMQSPVGDCVKSNH